MQPNGQSVDLQQGELDIGVPVGGYLPQLTEDQRQQLAMEHEQELDPNIVDPDDPSPFGPNSADPRTEEEFTNDAFGLPMIEQRSTRAAMSHLERQSAYESVVASALGGPMDTKRLVMEYGPLAKIESQMRGMVHDLTDYPEAGEVLLHMTRRCIHDVVVSNPALAEKEQNETGLIARMEAMDDLLIAMDERLPAFVAELDEACGADIEPLLKSFRNAVEVEKRRLDALAKNLQPATLGNRLLSNLEDVKDSLIRVFQSDNLVGDVRRHRNDALARALEGLTEASSELRSNAGDPEWERGDGVMVAQHASQFAEEVRSLTKGVEDQIDFGAVNAGLKTAHDNLGEAAEAAADKEHKNRLKKAMEVMREALMAIANALKKVFGRGDYAQPEAARPSPM